MNESAQVRISSLAMDALTDIEDLYGEDLAVLDAVLLFEVLVPSEDGDGQDTVVHRVSTSDRVAVNAGIIGLAHESVKQFVPND